MGRDLFIPFASWNKAQSLERMGHRPSNLKLDAGNIRGFSKSNIDIFFFPRRNTMIGIEFCKEPEQLADENLPLAQFQNPSHRWGNWGSGRQSDPLNIMYLVYLLSRLMLYYHRALLASILASGWTSCYPLLPRERIRDSLQRWWRVLTTLLYMLLLDKSALMQLILVQWRQRVRF